MILAKIVANLPWGLLLITDADSQEQILEWKSDDAVVAAAETALVVRAIIDTEGSASVRALDVSEGVIGRQVYAGTIDIPSGVLRMGDALGEQSRDMNLAPGRYEVQIFVDTPREATQIDVVITPAGVPEGGAQA